MNLRMAENINEIEDIVYKNIRYKTYQNGAPWIENDKEMLSYAFDYSKGELEAVYEQIDRELQNSVDYINEKYKKEMELKLTDKEFTLCCVGCSFTSDYLSFFNIVRKAIEPYRGIKIIDAAFNSETSTQTISRVYDRVLKYNPQITSVLIGINDMRQNNDVYSKPNVSPNEFRKNLNYIAKILRENGSRVIFNTLSPYDTLKMEAAVKEKHWTYYVGIDDIYNQIIRDVSRENGCVLNDMSAKFLEYDGPMNIPNNGLHLTHQANCFFADMFMDVLLKEALLVK